MIYPRRTALDAAASVEKALSGVITRLAHSGDLRMAKATMARIEFVVECPDRELLAPAMATQGWRKLRSGRGPMVFAKEGFPKAVVCVARADRSDLLGVAKHGNFEVLLFLRTGTAIFKTDIMRYLNACGLTIRPDQGLFQGDTLLAWTEEDIFISAGLSYIPPEERYSFDVRKHQSKVTLATW